MKHMFVLEGITFNSEQSTATFLVRQNDGTTTCDLKMVVTCNKYGPITISIPNESFNTTIDGLPEAITKFGEWMVRAGEAVVNRDPSAEKAFSDTHRVLHRV